MTGARMFDVSHSQSHSFLRRPSDPRHQHSNGYWPTTCCIHAVRVHLNADTCGLLPTSITFPSHLPLLSRDGLKSSPHPLGYKQSHRTDGRGFPSGKGQMGVDWQIVSFSGPYLGRGLHFRGESFGEASQPRSARARPWTSCHCPENQILFWKW
jgi:hypothetical protein